MYYNEAKYTRRNNRGNFEHDEATLSAALSEQDNVDECLKLVKTKTLEWLSDGLKGGVVAVNTTKLQVVKDEVKETAKEIKVQKTAKTTAAKATEKVKAVEETVIPEITSNEVDLDGMLDAGPVTPEEDILSADDVKKVIYEVVEKINPETAKKLLSDRGIAKVSEIPEHFYKDIVKEAKSLIAKANAKKK